MAWVFMLLAAFGRVRLSVAAFVHDDARTLCAANPHCSVHEGFPCFCVGVEAPSAIGTSWILANGTPDSLSSVACWVRSKANRDTPIAPERYVSSCGLLRTSASIILRASCWWDLVWPHRPAIGDTGGATSPLRHIVVSNGDALTCHDRRLQKFRTVVGM
jgi:hypothetical protein